MRSDLHGYVLRCAGGLGSLVEDEAHELLADFCRAFDAGSTIFLCGNGGSGSNATHICQDLGKSTLRPEDFDDDGVKRLKILSLTDNVPYILAWANDHGFERVFVEQLKNLAAPGDILIGLSGSGNSPNVLRAVEWANSHGLLTWGVTGFDGGRLIQMSHKSLHVPIDDMGIIECVHLLLFHWVLGELQDHINGESAESLEAMESQTDGAVAITEGRSPCDA